MTNQTDDYDAVDVILDMLEAMEKRAQDDPLARLMAINVVAALDERESGAAE